MDEGCGWRETTGGGKYLERTSVLLSSCVHYYFITCSFRKDFMYLFTLWWDFVAALRLSVAALSRGHPLVVVPGLLIVVASLVAEHGL